MHNNLKDIDEIPLWGLIKLLKTSHVITITGLFITILIGAFSLGNYTGKMLSEQDKLQLIKKIHDLENKLQIQNQSKKKANLKLNHSEINRIDLRFGLFLGWELGRYELLYDSIFTEAQQVSPKIYSDIQKLLDNDNFPKQQLNKDSKKLMKNVINYYSMTHIKKHSSILLGIAAFRISLVGTSKNESHNLEFEALALSTFREIDDSTVPQKMKLFEKLLDEKPEKISKIILLIDHHWKNTKM